MRVLKASSLLAINIVSLAMIASCGGGGGSNGNGTSQSGYYQLTANVITPSTPIYSVTYIPTTSSSTSIIIPSDTFTFNVGLNYLGSSSNTMLNATITSASICFLDPTIPGGECQPIPMSGIIKPNSNTATSDAINYYKYGAMALSTNPLQESAVISYTSIPLIYSTQGNGSVTMNASYQSNYNLSNTGITPGSIEIPFTVTYQTTSSTTFSSTTITNSTTSTTNNFSSSSAGSYTVSGVCVDNSNSGFNYVGSISGITCNGSINYQTGQITGFSINAPSTTQFSYTLSSSITNVGSNTTLTNEYIYNSLSLPSTTVSTIYYQYGQNTSTSTLVYTYLPSSTTYSYPFYEIFNYTPSYISYTPLGSSSSQIISCSQANCSLLGNYFSATLPSATGTAMLYYQQNLYQTLNPNILSVTHVSAVSIPAIFYVNVTLSDGETMSTSYSFNVVVQNP